MTSAASTSALAVEADPAGRLLTVNVGLPRGVAWRGRSVFTGVWKQPINGPQRVRMSNIDGDGQGDLVGHGGPDRAVLVYQLASYDHWRQYLERDDLTPGSFGENLTVMGLPDDEVCIGDQYEIGSTLFEVTQPRVTCYRVGMRLEEPRLPSLLVGHHRPGFYMRVLREGVVTAGDAIVKVRDGPERMSVADVDALLYLPGHDRADVARASRMAALSAGWRRSFADMVNAPDESTGNAGLAASSQEPPVAWTGLRPMRVADVVRETDTVRSVSLTPVDRDPLPPALPGQFVTVRLDLGDVDGGAGVTSRSYSISGPWSPSAYRISVKREPEGIVSTFVHTRLRPGAAVEMSAPHGRFTLTDSASPVLLVSAGIGATPVLAMLYALAQEKAARQVWWVHGARNGAEHAFAGETRELLAGLTNVRREICFSAPLPADVFGADYTHAGRLDAAFLGRLSVPSTADAYVCGPQPFMEDMRTALTAAGVEAANIRTELFGAGPSLTPGIASAPPVRPHPPLGEAGTGPGVTFARSGLTVPWPERFASVLELAEACDVPTRWSCRTGICHTCESQMISGTVSYDPPPLDQPAVGHVLICCALPTADVVLDL